MMPFITGEIVALVSAVGGGFFVKLLDRHYQFKEKQIEKQSETGTFRLELYSEIAKLKADLKEARAESDNWRARYYALLEDNYKNKSELERLRPKREPDDNLKPGPPSS